MVPAAKELLFFRTFPGQRFIGNKLRYVWGKKNVHSSLIMAYYEKGLQFFTAK